MQKQPGFPPADFERRKKIAAAHAAGLRPGSFTNKISESLR
jgi:hypothetical protein